MNKYFVPYTERSRLITLGVCFDKLAKGEKLTDRLVQLCKNMNINFLMDFEGFRALCFDAQDRIDDVKRTTISEQEYNDLKNRSEIQKKKSAMRRWAGIVFYKIKKGAKITDNHLLVFAKNNEESFIDLVKDGQDKQLFEDQIFDIEQRYHTLKTKFENGQI